MLPLAEQMQIVIPRTLQPWFADDSASRGTPKDNAASLPYLMEHGPRYRYFPSPSKSWYICKTADKPAAIEDFQKLNLPIQMTRGYNYLGGFIGSAETKEMWVGEKISVWKAAVKALLTIALKWPQTAYAGFTFVLQNEWQCVQHVVAGIGSLFAPLECKIRDHFLPSLIGIPACEQTENTVP